MNVPPYGDNFRKVFGNLATLHVTAQDVPDMTTKVSAGGFWYFTAGASSFIETSGGSSPAITAPVSNAKWVVIAMNVLGNIVLIDGTASATPVVPTITRGSFPLAFVYVPTGTTAITNDMVFDCRPFFGDFPRYHLDLSGTTEVGCHTIAAITNLQTTLDTKAATTDLTAGLATKSDLDGTSGEEFILNKDYAGVPAADIILSVERGSSANVGIRWKEDVDQWQYTFDGTNWYPLGVPRTITAASEPTLTYNGDTCIWINSGDANKTYLLYRRGSGDQVQVELT